MMQLLIVALLAGQPTTPAKALDLCVATHRAMASASVVVETENRITGLATNSARFELSFQQPSRLKMRVKQPKLGGQPASDRTYTFTPGKFAGLDTINNEYVVRPMPKEGSLAELSGTVMGSLDDAVQTILDPKVLDGEPDGAFSIVPIWHRLQAQGRLCGVPMDGFWMHVGDPAARDAAEARIRS